MKTVILCGGKGSRLSEQTKKIPKPMVKIGADPILVHIIKYYCKFGVTDFLLALGYKGSVIKKYFQNNKIIFKKKELNIKCVDTGINTLTGKRIKKLKKFLVKEKNFFLTYGDGVSNVDLNKLLEFHLRNKKIATLTAVRPPARFGQIYFSKNQVRKFDEKNQINSGWINGGFFVLNKKIFNYIPKENCMFETKPLENLIKKSQLVAYKHKDFWQCMDTIRDKYTLEELFTNNIAPWI